MGAEVRAALPQHDSLDRRAAHQAWFPGHAVHFMPLLVAPLYAGRAAVVGQHALSQGAATVSDRGCQRLTDAGMQAVAVRLR